MEWINEKAGELKQGVVRAMFDRTNAMTTPALACGSSGEDGLRNA